MGFCDLQEAGSDYLKLHGLNALSLQQFPQNQKLFVLREIFFKFTMLS